MKNQYKKFAPRLADLGYDTTPVVGKRPIIEGWSKRPDAAKDYNKYADNGIGVVLGGAHNLIAIDVDVMNPFAVNDIERLISDHLGDGPKRIGKAPKFLMVFRSDKPMTKIKTAVYDIEACDDDGCVEVLAEGQQFVASGIHPDTGTKYNWPNDNLTDYKIVGLPEVSVDAVMKFIQAANELLSKYGAPKKRLRDGASTASSRNSLNLKDITAPIDEIEAAIMHTPNDDVHYDEWVEMAHALKGALGDKGFDLFCRWSARSTKDDPAQNERLWHSIGNVTRIGAGSIFYYAGEHGFDVANYRNEKKQSVTIGEAKPAPTFNEETGEIVADNPLIITPFRNILAKDMPQRQWLYGNHLVRGYVSATISAGGIGKTTLALTDALSMVLNKKLLHDMPHDQLRVCHYNLEDPLEELERRLLGIMKAYKVTYEDIKDKLFINSGRDRKVIVADKGEHNTLIQMPDADALYKQITRHKIDVISIDPFVKAHYLDENDNKAIDFVLTILGDVADKAGCAIDIIHHIRKPPTGSAHANGDINMARGASAISGAVRAARTLSEMSEKDADALGITPDRRRFYVRIDDAKGNMSAPVSKAVWCERQSVHLNNGPFGSEGDSVGYLDVWTPPDAFDGMTVEKIHNILNIIDKGVDDDQQFLLGAQSKRWVGNAIVDNVLEKSKSDAKQIVKTWFTNGLLKVENYKNGATRKDEDGVFVDWSKQPGNVS
jgi:hypothetical protein